MVKCVSADKVIDNVNCNSFLRIAYSNFLSFCGMAFESRGGNNFLLHHFIYDICWSSRYMLLVYVLWHWLSFGVRSEVPTDDFPRCGMVILFCVHSKFCIVNSSEVLRVLRRTCVLLTSSMESKISLWIRKSVLFFRTHNG